MRYLPYVVVYLNGKGQERDALLRISPAITDTDALKADAMRQLKGNLMSVKSVVSVILEVR